MSLKKKSLDIAQIANEQDGKLLEQVTELTQRIQVLEKIVTDEGYQVQKDINQL